MRDHPTSNQDLQHLLNLRDLLSDKLAALEKQRILETRAEEVFRLQQLIDETSAERERIEQRLLKLESAPSVAVPATPAPPQPRPSQHVLWIIAGIVVVAAAVLAQLIFPSEPSKPVVVKSENGVAAGRDIRNSTITITPSPIRPPTEDKKD